MNRYIVKPSPTAEPTVVEVAEQYEISSVNLTFWGDGSPGPTIQMWPGGTVELAASSEPAPPPGPLNTYVVTPTKGADPITVCVTGGPVLVTPLYQFWNNDAHDPQMAIVVGPDGNISEAPAE